jgi:NAD dependent epimerase/dehydratase
MVGETVLVTGAGGFIGSHLVERLVEEGAAVRALCRYTSGTSVGNLRELPADALAEVDLQFGDLRDADGMRAMVEGVDVVYHLAASISVAYSYVAPREVVESNVMGTLNILTAAREAGTQRVVHMSSSEVYGTAQYTPIDEAHPLHPQSPYAASKVSADKLAEAFCLSFDVPVVIARPFNTFGPRQSQRAVIATIVAQALNGTSVFIGATSPRRDFVCVDDTVEALVQLGSSRSNSGETFNISTGVDVSIDTIIERVESLLGRELQVWTDERRLRPERSEVLQLVGSSAKLRAAYQWEPRTCLDDGLRTVIEWMRSQSSIKVEAKAI